MFWECEHGIGTRTKIIGKNCRDSEKSASQNKLNNLNKLSAKLRILFLIQAYHLICLSKQSIFPSTVI